MKNIIFILILLMGFNQVKAHDLLTEILVYSNDYSASNYTVVVSYNLSESDLENLQQISRIHYDMKKLVKRSGSGALSEYRKVGSTDCDFGKEVQTRTCGVIDHFSRGRSAAIDVCNSYAVTHLLSYNLIPQFVGPTTFTNSDSSSNDHHVLYDFSQGLEFNCVAVMNASS